MQTNNEIKGHLLNEIIRLHTLFVSAFEIYAYEYILHQKSSWCEGQFLTSCSAVGLNAQFAHELQWVLTLSNDGH